MAKRLFYTVSKCHFCKSRMKGNYIGFAKLTDYICSNKKCSKKFGYYVSYDNASEYYYEIGFFYKNTSFRFYLDGEIYKSVISINNTSFTFPEEIRLSNIKEINNLIKKIKNLSLFS